MTNTTSGQRPATVRVAAVLMTGTALIYLISAFVLIWQTGRSRAWIRDEFESFDPDGGPMLGLVQSAPVVVAVLTIVAALLLLGAVAAVRSGSQAGRVFAWVVMGLLLLCGTSAVSNGGTPDFGNNMTMRSTRFGGPGESGTMSYTLPDSYAAAHRIVSGVFAGLAMVALIVAIVLLARPSAGRWFRPQRFVQQPGHHPMPYPGRQGQFGGPPPGQFAAPQPWPVAAPQPWPVAAPQPGQPGPPWSRPVDGGTVRPATRPQPPVDAELAILVRRHQRGEITDAEFEAARARLTGS
jgi:hypothetical protein